MTADQLRKKADTINPLPGVAMIVTVEDGLFAAAALRVLADIADWATRNAHQGGWREAGKEVLALIQQANGQP